MTVPMTEGAFTDNVLSKESRPGDEHPGQVADGYDAIPEKAFDEEETDEKAKADHDEKVEGVANAENIYRTLTLNPDFTAATNPTEQAQVQQQNDIELVEMGNGAIHVISSVYGPVEGRAAEVVQDTGMGLNAVVNGPADQERSVRTANRIRKENNWAQDHKVIVGVLGVGTTSLLAGCGLLVAFLTGALNDDPKPAPDTTDKGVTPVCGFVPGTNLQTYVDENVAAWRKMDEAKVWCVITAWATATDINGEPIPDVTAPTIESQPVTLVALALIARKHDADGKGLPTHQAEGEGWHTALTNAKENALVSRKDSALLGKPLAWSGETDTETMLNLYRDAASLELTPVDGPAKPLHRALKLAVLSQTIKPWKPGDPIPGDPSE